MFLLMVSFYACLSWITGASGCKYTFQRSYGVITYGNVSGSLVNNGSCTFEISAIQGNQVTLTFLQFYLLESDGCNETSLKIYDGQLSDNNLKATMCGNDTSGYTSETGKVYLVLTTDGLDASEGFAVRYTGCSYHLTNESGTFDSPVFPPPLQQEFCSFLIEVPQTGKINISFTNYRLDTCCDYLTFYDGSSTAAPMIGHMTGVDLKNVASSSGTLYFEFRCMHCVSAIRFTAHYESYTLTETATSTAPYTSWMTTVLKVTTPPVDLGKVPRISKKPIIYASKQFNRLAFFCDFASSKEEKTAIFEITWYEGYPGGKTLRVDKLKWDQRSSIFLNTKKFPEKPEFRMGTTISCDVRSWYSTSPKDVSPRYHSNLLFAGLKVTPSKLVISENGPPLKINVTSTVPILCRSSATCSLAVNVLQDNYDIFLSKCSLDMKNNDKAQTLTLEVNAKRDFVNDGDKVVKLKITVKANAEVADWVGHKELQDITIVVKDIPTARCQSNGDPRIITFDHLYYSYFQPGDHVLVKSTNRQFEVHARTIKCGGVTCNCGVAAKEDNDVIVFDACKDRVPKIFFRSTSKPKSGTSVWRNAGGRSFIFKFPSGSFVRIDNFFVTTSAIYSNVIVQVPSDDFLSTRGLCGKFDGNWFYDLIAKNGKIFDAMDWYGGGLSIFAASWKIPVGKSLFYFKTGKNSCKENDGRKYCMCNGRTSQCPYTTIYHREDFETSLSGWTEMRYSNFKKCPNARKRRSVQHYIILPNDVEGTDYIYDPKPIVNVTLPKWPTALGKTMEKVQNYCRNAIINSETGKVCSEVPEFNFTTFLLQCVEDIKVSDDYAFTAAAVRAMQDSCEEVFLTNTSLWENDPSSNGTKRPPKKISDTLCPNLCSGNGVCRKGVCICNENYTSPDCSIDKSKGPVIESLPMDGLCDIRKRNDCHLVKVKGDNFLDSSNMTCRSTKLQISDSEGYKATSDVTIGSAYLLSFAEVVCRVTHSVYKSEDGHAVSAKPYQGSLLEISNDKILYSKERLPYLIFDSKCIICSIKSKQCKLKTNTCVIKGYCYSNGEASASDACAKCDPSSSTTVFTKDKACNDSLQMPWIVGGSVGGAVLFLSLFVIICYKKRKIRVWKMHKKTCNAQFENKVYED